MLDRETFEHLLPLACEWAKAQEELILARGASLGPQHAADAGRAGVQGPSRIRVLVVDRIPLPENEQLVAAARHTQIITGASRGVAFGYGIIIRADCWSNRELLCTSSCTSLNMNEVTTSSRAFGNIFATVPPAPTSPSGHSKKKRGGSPAPFATPKLRRSWEIRLSLR